MRISKLLFSFLCFTCVACTPLQMTVPADLIGMEPYVVVRKTPFIPDSPLSFGSWSTDDVEAGTLWDITGTLKDVDVAYLHSPFHFVIRSATDEYEVQCLTRSLTLSKSNYGQRTSSTTTVDAGYGWIPLLSCAFKSPAEGSMRMFSYKHSEEKGEVQFGQETWEIKSVHDFVGAKLPSADPLGYVLADANTPLAAVETVNGGRVWLLPDLSDEEKNRLAMVASVLLMYQSPDKLEDDFGF